MLTAALGLVSKEIHLKLGAKAGKAAVARRVNQ